jgi:hypothetical protein
MDDTLLAGSRVEALHAAIKKQKATQEHLDRIGRRIEAVGQILANEPEVLLDQGETYLDYWRTADELRELAKSATRDFRAVNDAYDALSESERAIVGDFLELLSRPSSD